MTPTSLRRRFLSACVRRFLHAAGILLALAPLGELPAQATADREAVRLAVLDYVEGVYLGQPDRIRKSVAPSLAKLGMNWNASDGVYRASPMTFTRLVDVATTYSKNTKVPANAPKKIDIYDVLDRTASVKLTAMWGVDYMLLAKQDDGRWLITHVLWQSPPR